MKRKLFGISSEKLPKADRTADEELETEPARSTAVKAHTRTSKPKSVRKDLYESLPIKRVDCIVPEEMRFCPDCNTPMVHMGYSFVREELHIIPEKVCRIQYYQEKLKCPACEDEGDTTILAACTPSALLKHSPASPDMVAEVMYQKVFMDLPFYRQEKYWKQLGVSLPRETAANWFNTCALEYLEPVYQLLHKRLLEREVIHANEVPCQVLHEEGKDASSKSYIWVYLTGTDSLPKIVLYDYKLGRSGAYPAEIAFQYMAPYVFENRQFDYIQNHLRILSAFYGVLKPMDGITPYRLEMQAKAEIEDTKNLYDYWGERLYRSEIDDDRVMINLASKEYSKCIEKYLSDKDKYITVTFCEQSGDKLVTKGTYAKMARGEMVRYMAEKEIENPTDIQKFDRLGYIFRRDLSSESGYVFERKIMK